VVRTVSSCPDALGAQIITPAAVNGHIRRVESYISRCSHPNHIAPRQEFIKRCVASRFIGFIELPLHEFDDGEPEQRIHAISDSKGLWQRFLSWLASFLSQPKPEQKAPSATPLWQEYGPESGNRGEFLKKSLRRQIETALEYPQESVNLGNYRHPLVTEGLNQFLLRRGLQSSTKRIRITHSDGTVGEPFPLFVIKPYKDDWQPARELHVGLISMRHLPLDREVDFYWFTNAEVPARCAGAAAERYCFQASITKLRKLHKQFDGKPVHIYMYHTGFLPAVVGFYRSVATCLEASGDRDPWLRVTPVFGPKDTGESADSSGMPWPMGVTQSQTIGLKHGYAMGI
jgi:hypothetical protein